MVARWSGRIPMSTCSNRNKLFPNSPAPTSNTTAVVNSSTTSFEPIRRHTVPADPRLPSARSCRISGEVNRIAGVNENKIAASAAIAAAKISTRGCNPSSCKNGIDPTIAAGTSRTSSCIVQLASASPSTAAAATNKNPSVTNCRINRDGDAPSAVRTAISRRRVSERTSTRLATLIVAMISSSAAPASSTSKIGRTSPTITSLSGLNAAPCPRLLSGYSFSSCAAIAFTSASAIANVTPSFSRPSP